jgi:hypothetical protein
MGDPVLFSDIMDQDRSFIFMLAEVSQGMKGVFGLFRKHDQKYWILGNSLVRQWAKKNPRKIDGD